MSVSQSIDPIDSTQKIIRQFVAIIANNSLNACVLYPAPLRDLLVQLATARIFKPNGQI